jgi:hypothetical protein
VNILELAPNYKALATAVNQRLGKEYSARYIRDVDTGYCHSTKLKAVIDEILTAARSRWRYYPKTAK